MAKSRYCLGDKGLIVGYFLYLVEHRRRIDLSPRAYRTRAHRGRGLFAITAHQVNEDEDERQQPCSTKYSSALPNFIEHLVQTHLAPLDADEIGDLDFAASRDSYIEREGTGVAFFVRVAMTDDLPIAADRFEYLYLRCGVLVIA